MFGISLYEYIIIIIVMILSLKPKDFVSIIKSLFDLIDTVKSYCKKIETEIKKLDLLKDYTVHEVYNKKEDELSDDNNKQNQINKNKEK